MEGSREAILNIYLTSLLGELELADLFITLLALGAGLLIGLISLSGLITLSADIDRVRRISKFLVALSAGTMIGGAAFHLLPESVDSLGGGFNLNVTVAFLAGILVSYLLESVLEWHHCNQIGGCEEPSHRHSIGAMNIYGDSVHNFIDGLIIAAGFLISPFIGFTVVFAVALHEIPQEFGDFGVLIQAGYSRRRALLYNFLSALMALVGIIVVLTLGDFTFPLFEAPPVSLSTILLPFAAGNFIYVSLTDLMPELHKERRTKHTLIQFLVLLLGITLMASLLFLPL